MPSVTVMGTASQPKKLQLEDGVRVGLTGCVSLLESEAVVVTSSCMVAAAGEAGFAVPERAHAGDFPAAVRAMVEVPADESAGGGERNRVAALFPGESEIAAGPAPLRSVRFDAATRMPGVGDEVGEFVEEGASKLLGKREQARVEEDERAPRVCHARRGPQAGIPSEAQHGGEGRQVQAPRPCARFFLKMTCHLRGIGRGGLEGTGRHGLQIEQPGCAAFDVLSTTCICASAL